MDLQTASGMNAKRWQVFRLLALLCFAIASGLLVSSLLSPSRAGPKIANIPWHTGR